MKRSSSQANKLFPNQLAQHLRQSALAPCYLVFGDEPLQQQECIGLIIQAARAQGFEEVEHLYLEGHSDWAQIADAMQGMSLFSPRRVLVMDLGEAKPQKTLTELLLQFAQQPDPDLLLLLKGGKRDKAGQNAKWFKQLLAIGMSLQVNQLQGDPLRRWLGQRAQQHQLQLTPDAFEQLLHSTEGNMLAMDQELQKLALSFPGQRLDAQQLQSALIDQSRFNVFQLADTLHLGQLSIASHMLAQLRAEGVEPMILLWTLVREWQTLANMALQPVGLWDQHLQNAGVWRNRVNLFKRSGQRLGATGVQALGQRLAHLEAMLKGIDPQSQPWSDFEHILVLWCTGAAQAR